MKSSGEISRLQDELEEVTKRYTTVSCDYHVTIM